MCVLCDLLTYSSDIFGELQLGYLQLKTDVVFDDLDILLTTSVAPGFVRIKRIPRVRVPKISGG